MYRFLWYKIINTNLTTFITGVLGFIYILCYNKHKIIDSQTQLVPVMYDQPIHYSQIPRKIKWSFI